MELADLLSNLGVRARFRRGLDLTPAVVRCVGGAERVKEAQGDCREGARMPRRALRLRQA
jgi:hypothetical protein